MAHRYGKAIHVGTQDGIPSRFCWKHVHYPDERVFDLYFDSVDSLWVLGMAPD